MEGKPVKTPKEFMGVVDPSVVGRMRVFRWIGRRGMGRPAAASTDA